MKLRQRLRIKLALRLAAAHHPDAIEVTQVPLHCSAP